MRINNSEDTKFLLKAYRALVLPRLIEEKMLLLLRQGKVSKWFSGIGQEAIAVGATLALETDEYILPLHRNLGVFTTRGLPLVKLFAQLQGLKEGFTKARDRSFHFGTVEYKIIGMISHLAAQIPVANGIALARKLKKEKKVTLVFTGEGGTSQGDFHEALNVAAVWNLPVIFLIENNGYGLSTPITEQYSCKQLSERARGYGIKGLTIDGNNLLEVYRTVSEAAKEIRKNPAPVLIECMTFRMRGHEEASGTKYVPKELFAEWEKKDPILLFEKTLIKEKILSADKIGSIKEEITQEINLAIEQAFSLNTSPANTAEELAGVFRAPPEKTRKQAKTSSKKLRFVDAISEGLKLGMEQHANLIIMGQDIAEYGGVFKVTEGFLERFGKERIRNTPLCESAILGMTVGLSACGMKSIVEMQFADFVSCGFNQIVNNMAKLNYRWGQNVDAVIRLPTGAGTRAGPFHSQSTEAWFFRVPGLKIVYPAFPEDAKGLVLAAIEDPNPVLYFEHKLLYRSIQGAVPDGYYSTPIGQARLVREGREATIVSYGLGVHWALDYQNKNDSRSFDIIDLRSLQPLDFDLIAQSVKKTGRVLVLHEDTLTGGIGAEISARINEELFGYLDAPVMRCASLDTPIPFSAPLEDNFLGKSRLDVLVDKLVAF